MKNKITGVCMLFFLTVFVTPWTVLAQIPSPTTSCTGDSWPDGSYYGKGKKYSKVYNGRTYNCVGCGGCVPVGKQSAPYAGGYSSKQDFQMQMMHGLMGALFQSIFSPSTGTSAQNKNEIEKQKAMKKMLEEQKKQAALEAWFEFQKEKKELLHSFKGTQDQSHGLKTSSGDAGKLQLKTYANAGGKENSDALMQLKSIESSSGKAAQYAKTDSPETAHKLSQFEAQKQDEKPAADASEKELTDTQMKERNRIISETETLVSEMIETDKELAQTREAIDKTKAQARANRENAEEITSKLLKAANEVEKEELKAEYYKLNAEYEALAARIKTLDQDAERLMTNADKKRKKYEDLKRRYDQLLSAVKTVK